MEIGLREWLIIGGAAVVLLIILDGWRRMKGARNRLRMDIEPQSAEVPEETDSYNPELPNGGARVVDDLCADALETVASEAVAESRQETDKVSEQPIEESPAIVDSVEISEDVAVGTVDAVRTEPTFDLPIAEERVEPVLNVSSLSSLEELAPAALVPAEQSVDTVAEAVEPDMPVELTPYEQKVSATNELDETESVDIEEAPVQATVVEEEIMTSAALFEAIEQSRQQRSAAAMEQTLEDESYDPDVADALSLSSSGVEADDSAGIDKPEEQDETAEVAVARKPDPLLRPLPQIESEAFAEPKPIANSDEPITLSEGPLSDDPLLDGADEESETSDDVEAVHGLVAEPELNQASKLDLADVEPRFIQDLQPELEAEWASRATSPATQPTMLEEAPEPELDLPPEFALPIDKLAQSIDDTPVQGALMSTERAETVVAFPEKKTRTKESEVAQIETTETEIESCEGDNEVKVNAGSLRQQPDPANVLVMTVIANHADGFNGDVLMKLVLACGMRFGEMDIFHRFEDGIDTGAVQFSMANATGTGTFNVNNMAELQTRAVSFFMSMEEPREVMNAFECMLATAETLARHLNGELVDENRIVMRPQTQEHYRQRVRDFEMRNLRRRSG